jgi:hypothetical protein
MCRQIWQFVQWIPVVIERIWTIFVSTPWRLCSAQTCRWWCLCCNKWICWILVIISAILAIVFIILYIVLSITVLTICESLCILLTFLQGPTDRPSPQCFAYGPAPGTGPDPSQSVPPTVSITQPTNQAGFPEGDTVPITFTATAFDPDGTALTGSAVRWYEDLITVPATFRLLGEGTQISLTLPHRPIDESKNQPSDYYIRVTATGTNGRTASASVNIRVGRVRLA